MGDDLIEAGNRIDDGTELGRLGLNGEAEDLDDRRIIGESASSRDLGKAFFDHSQIAAMVLLVKLPHGGGPCTLDGREGGPLL